MLMSTAAVRLMEKGRKRRTSRDTKPRRAGSTEGSEEMRVWKIKGMREGRREGGMLGTERLMEEGRTLNRLL